jgi:phosphonate transport system permease protein
MSSVAAAERMSPYAFGPRGIVRSSVVLGLVGAGGIGLELKVAGNMFDYPTAATSS